MYKHLMVDKLRVGDVVGTTDLINPLALITRWRTWGPKAWMDPTKSTHTFVVCDRGGGLFYASEMQPKGLEMGELHAYDNGTKSALKHVCFVGRHQEFDDWALREAANDYMKEQHAFGIKYGFGELVQFLFPKATQQYPYKIVCSQWAVNVFNKVEITNPFGEQTSPRMWQEWNGLKNITKEVVRA